MQQIEQLSLDSNVLVTTIDSGVELTIRRMMRRRRVRPEWVNAAVEEERQLALKLPWPYRSRYNKRPCKYPYEMVERARKLRRWGFTYKEISEELTHQFHRDVPWLTVRDWCVMAWRRMG